MLPARRFFSLVVAVLLSCACLYLFLGDGLRPSPLRSPNNKDAGTTGCSEDKWEGCVPAKYRDVSDIYSCRRKAGMDFSGMDFREIIRLRSGVKPKLISTRTRPVNERPESAGQEYVVPNVVHYIYFGRGMKFTFMQYIGYLSAHKFIQPDYIFLFGDNLPKGPWWQRTLADVPNIYHVYVDDRPEVNGRPFRYPTQHSNLLRLRIMLDYGGIYLDHDVIVVKSFDPLRKYDFTMGREVPFSLNNGVMLGRQGAPFAQIWLETYRSPKLNLNKFGYESVRMAHNLSVFFPHLVHVEERSLAQPNYLHAELFYRDPYDWSGNYAVHVMRENVATIPTNAESLKGYDCMMGQVMRLVYFGDAKLLSNKTWKGMK